MDIIKNILIKNVFLWIITIIWTAVIIILYFYKNKGLLEIIPIAISGFGVLLPLCYSAKNAIEDRKFKIIENTYDLISKFDDPHLAEARKFTRTIKEKNEEMSNNDKLKEIDEKQELKHSTILLLNYFLGIYMSIENNRVNEKEIKKYLGKVVADIIDRFDCFIKRDFSDIDKEIFNELKAKMQKE